MHEGTRSLETSGTTHPGPSVTAQKTAIVDYTARESPKFPTHNKR